MFLLGEEKKKEATLKQCLYEWTVTLAQIDSTNLKDCNVTFVPLKF